MCALRVQLRDLDYAFVHATFKARQRSRTVDGPHLLPYRPSLEFTNPFPFPVALATSHDFTRVFYVSIRTPSHDFTRVFYVSIRTLSHSSIRMVASLKQDQLQALNELKVKKLEGSNMMHLRRPDKHAS